MIFIPYPYFCGLCGRSTPYLAALPEISVPVGRCCHSSVTPALKASEWRYPNPRSIDEREGANTRYQPGGGP
jgi:hypothetical protein